MVDLPATASPDYTGPIDVAAMVGTPQPPPIAIDYSGGGQVFNPDATPAQVKADAASAGATGKFNPSLAADAITAAQARYEAASTALTTKLTNLGDGGAGGGAAAAIAKGAADSTVSSINEAAAIQKQKDDASAAAMVGLTPGAPSQLITSIAQKSAEQEAEAMALHEKIIADRGKSFWDNPLDWLTTQIALPYDVDEYNSRVANINQMQGYVGDMSKRFDEQARVNASIDNGASTARQVALGQSITAGAQMQAAQFNLEGAKVGTQQVQILSSLARGDYEIVFQSSQELEKLQLFSTNQTLAQQEIDKNAIMIRQAQRNEDDRIATTNMLASYGAATGTPIMTPEQFDRMPGDFKLTVSQVVARYGVTNQLGANPVDAMNNANKLGWNLGAGAGTTLQQLKTELTTIMTANRGGSTIADGLTPLQWEQASPESKLAKANESLVANIRTQFQSGTGMYAPVSAASLIKATTDPDTGKSNIAELPVMAAITQIAAQNPNYKINGDDLMNQAISLIQGGVPADQVYKQIYQVGVAQSAVLNSSRGFNQLVMPIYSLKEGNGANNSPYPLAYTNQYDMAGGQFKTMNINSVAAIQQAVERQLAGYRFQKSSFNLLGKPFNNPNKVNATPEYDSVILQGIP